MRLLLDTHTLIWWWTDDARLPEECRQAIELADVYISAVSVWEMVGKQRRGKLAEADVIVPRLWSFVKRDGFETLPISLQHAERGAQYNMLHRDPFDRLLAAQAELDGLVLVTRDEAFDAFPCATRW